MTKRRLVWMAVAVCVALVVCIVGREVLGPSDQVNWQNASRIKYGMTESEVDYLLGRAADAQTATGYQVRVPVGDSETVAEEAVQKRWIQRGVPLGLWVGFSKDGVVVSIFFITRSLDPSERSPFDHLLAWLGW